MLEGYRQLEDSSTGQNWDKINNDSIGSEAIEQNKYLRVHTNVNKREGMALFILLIYFYLK